MMTALWPLSRKLRDVSIIDILWAPAFAAIAVLAAVLGPVREARGWIVLGLVSAWAIRLGRHVYSRWRRLGHEDYRYAEIRRKRGPNFPLTSLFWVFWLQAVLLWIVSWPLQTVFAVAAPLHWVDGLGVAMAVAGILIEAVSDAQLNRFRTDTANRGTVLDSGLWSWSRHPNYFGDFLMWWGFFAIAVAGGAPWWIALGPAVMTALLVQYSGAGLMEDTIGQRRPGYADYARRTSLFVPWPPRR